VSAPRPNLSSYYSAPINSFLVEEPNAVIGQLTLSSDFAVEGDQRDAWNEQIAILQRGLVGINGTVFFEFVVPRIGSRIDAVIITGSAVVVVEFKVGSDRFTLADENQVWDYALDLKNFHSGSHDAPIFPVLVATEAPNHPPVLSSPHHDNVYRPMRANAHGIGALVHLITRSATGPVLNADTWARSPYRPTPTIIQAAQALYANHSVDAITRNDAGRENLSHTSQTVEQIIENARATHSRAIVFITGVPGAGKTLVGLNIATKRREVGSPTHAVYLSGNGPLVKVLCEALTRDEVLRLKVLKQRRTKAEVGQPIKAFIQNVHHFRDAGLRDTEAPSDHVVIFDEAQRAWDREMTIDFMRRKKRQPDFNSSEPEFLISYLDRHRDWAVIVCLVGGGQEINRGEAGISAWLDAVREKFQRWDVYAPASLLGTEYAAEDSLNALRGRANLTLQTGLHLSTSIRSFRAERVSDFVHALLACEQGRAKELLQEFREKYPIVVTRDLGRAKSWIRSQARGSERVGLVASSAASRLKPHAIDIRVQIDPVHWFLNSAGDTRSSMYLEDAATEFQVQGLELDWTCVTWDADLRLTSGIWEFHSFVGSRWNCVRKADRRRYLTNAYRVLLTRARQGMAIFVPPGSPEDPTRDPVFYNETFDYLGQLGIPAI
jgi:hypothetical protein